MHVLVRLGLARASLPPVAKRCCWVLSGQSGYVRQNVMLRQAKTPRFVQR